MSQLCLKRVQKSRTIPSRGYEEIVQTPCLEMIAAGSRHHIWPSFLIDYWLKLALNYDDF